MIHRVQYGMPVWVQGPYRTRGPCAARVEGVNRRHFAGLAGAAALVAGALVLSGGGCGGPEGSNFPPVSEAARLMENPVPNTPEVIKEGETLYLTTCATCHGYATDGFGPQYQLYVPRPTSFKKPWFQAQTDGAIFYNAWNGSPNNKDKPAAKNEGKITEQDLWKIVRFLRTAPDR